MVIQYTSKSNRNKLYSFIIAISFFALVFFTTGIWSESYQHMYDTAISGEFSNQMPGTAYNPFPEYMPRAANVFHALTAFYPMRWIFFFLYGVLFVSVWVIFYRLLVISEKFSHWSRVLLVLFFATLIWESVALYHMVRVAMFAGIAGMSVLLTDKSNKLFTLRHLPYILLFIVGLWIRGNVIFFMLFFLTGVFVIHKTNIKPLFPYWIAMMISLLHYLSIVFWTDYSDDLNFFFLYNTEFKLHHTGQYTPDLKLENALDSVKYTAISHDILADEQHLPASYYDQIGIFTNLSKTSLSQFWYAYSNFIRLMKENYFLILADVFLVLTYLLLGGAPLKNYKIKTIGVFVFFYLIILGISFIKMENRFLVPYQTFFLFTMVAIHQPKLFTEQKYSKLLLAFVLFVFFTGLPVSLKKVANEKMETENFKNGFQFLRETFANTTLVYNTGFITKNKPYEMFYQKQWFEQFYLYNYFAVQLHPMYRPYLEYSCKCNVGNLNEFYEFLNNQESEIVLLDNEDRIDALVEFIRAVYEREMIIEKIDLEKPIELVGFNEQLSIFILRDIL